VDIAQVDIAQVEVAEGEKPRRGRAFFLFFSVCLRSPAIVAGLSSCHHKPASHPLRLHRTRHAGV